MSAPTIFFSFENRFRRLEIFLPQNRVDRRLLHYDSAIHKRFEVHEANCQVIPQAVDARDRQNAKVLTAFEDLYSPFFVIRRGHHLEIKSSRRTRRYAGKSVMSAEHAKQVKRLLPYL